MALPPQGLTGGGSASTFTQVVVSWIQFHMVCWTEGLSSSLAVGWRSPSVLCHVGFTKAWLTHGGWLPSEWMSERAREGEQDEARVFLWLNLRNDTPLLGDNLPHSLWFSFFFLITVVFICISLMTNAIEHLFTYVLAVHISCGEINSHSSFCPFKKLSCLPCNYWVTRILSILWIHILH